MNIIMQVPESFVDKFYERVGKDRTSFNNGVCQRLYKEYAIGLVHHDKKHYDAFFDYLEKISANLNK